MKNCAPPNEMILSTPPSPTRCKTIVLPTCKSTKLQQRNEFYKTLVTMPYCRPMPVRLSLALILSANRYFTQNQEEENHRSKEESSTKVKTSTKTPQYPKIKTKCSQILQVCSRSGKAYHSSNLSRKISIPLSKVHRKRILE